MFLRKQEEKENKSKISSNFSRYRSPMRISKSSNGMGMSPIKKRRARKVANRMKTLLSTKNSLNSSVSGVKEGDSGSGSPFRMALIQNSSNFRKSGAPSKFMYYCSDGWKDMSKEEVVATLKSGFAAGVPAVEASVEGSRFLFDFLRMLQTDLVTGHERSIAWIDVNGRCFFPKFFVDEGVKTVCEMPLSSKMNIGIRMKTNSSKDSDKLPESVPSIEHIDENVAASHEKPPYPISASIIPLICLDTPKWPHVEMLNEGDKKYMDVKDMFLSGIKSCIPNVIVTSIGKCLHSGPIGIARCKDFQSQMEITNSIRGSANVKLAWHGTISNCVTQIVAHGFSQPSRLPNSRANAIGVYLFPQHLPQLSVSSSLPDDNGDRHVILCRVILGNTEKVDAPENPQFHPSSENYDCGVDDLANPSWYCVWTTHMNRHILPEYVLSFKSTNQQQQGLPKTRKMMPFSRLFAELGKDIPSSKLQEILILYDQYRVGKMTKNELIKKVRTLVGDQLLRATIKKA